MFENKINENMPHYSQYGGACGLTSALMGIKPNENGIKELFEVINNKYKNSLFHSEKDEGKKFQQSFELLLYEIYINKEFQKILKNRLKSYFNDAILPLLNNKYDFLQQKMTQDKLMFLITTWKNDWEIKTIYSLLGIKFINYRKGKISHAGAVAFCDDDTEEIKSLKKNFLYENIKKENIVLICNSVHWVIVKDCDEKLNNLKIIDPIGGRESIREILNDNYFRYYVFEYNIDKINKNVEKCIEILKK